MKFEKKVIIGSLGGFLTTFIGIIAVFFPSLLNFEKKNMEEIKIFIKSEADIQKFKKAILDNKGKLIDLDLEYCMDYSHDTRGKVINGIRMSNFKILGDSEDNFVTINGIVTKEQTVVDNNSLKQGMLIIYNPTPMYETSLPTNTHGGAFIIKNNNEEESMVFPNMVINIPYKTKGKYKWDTDIHPNKSDVCYAEPDEDGEETRYYQHIQGIFFINDEIEELNAESEDVFDKVIELEPFNKKDLKIREY